MPTSLLPAPSPDPSETVADRLTRRVATRDAPPPPLSQEPTAVLARVADYLKVGLGQRSPRARQRLARMLLLLIDHPEITHFEARGVNHGLHLFQPKPKKGAWSAGVGLVGQPLLRAAALFPKLPQQR